MVNQETLPALPKGYEEWSEKLKAAATNYRTSIWEIGDLLNDGEQRFGELFAQAAEETKLAPQTLMNAKWVCSSIPKNTRHDDLSFSLHMEVAKLGNKNQKAILGLAVDQGWTSKEVRTRVKAVISGDDKALLPEWKPSQRGTSPQDSAGSEPSQKAPPEPADVPESEMEPSRDVRPNLNSRAQYIAFHTAELKVLSQDTAPSMIVDDLEGNALTQFFMDAEDVQEFLAGIGNHKP